MRRTHSRSARASSSHDARFRTLFERASVGIIRVGAGGRAVEANAAVERMLGYGRGELVGVGFADFTHPDDLDVSNSLFQGCSTSSGPPTSTRSATSARTER